MVETLMLKLGAENENESHVEMKSRHYTTYEKHSAGNSQMLRVKDQAPIFY